MDQVYSGRHGQECGAAPSHSARLLSAQTVFSPIFSLILSETHLRPLASYDLVQHYTEGVHIDCRRGALAAQQQLGGSPAVSGRWGTSGLSCLVHDGKR